MTNVARGRHVLRLNNLGSKYDRAINAHPGNADLYLLRAVRHCVNHCFEEAIADSERAIELNPSLKEAYTRKGVALCSLKRLLDARAAFLDASTRAPDRPGETRSWLDKLDRMEQKKRLHESIVVIGAETKSGRSQAGEVEKVVEACRPSLLKITGDNRNHMDHHVGEDATNSVAQADAAVSNLDVLASTSAPVTSLNLRITEESYCGLSGAECEQGNWQEMRVFSDGSDEAEKEEKEEEEEEEEEEEGEEADDDEGEEEDEIFSDCEEEVACGEVPTTEEGIQQLVDELLQAESEAAEAQEALEDESLDDIQVNVRMELADSYSGSELEAAVNEEIDILKDQWQETLADLEDKVAILQEKLDDAGVSLPDLYKWIEKQAPEGCTTEAWRKRTHWAGLQATQEVFEVVSKAEVELKQRRPVRRHHGRLQDEGASGFLERKVKRDSKPGSSDEGWAMVGFLDKEDNPRPGKLMGSKKWAAVYMASTPEQAAALGLDLPGVDCVRSCILLKYVDAEIVHEIRNWELLLGEVEEIGDIEDEDCELLTEALENERERGLTDRQKTSLKKVREEDDVKKSQRLKRRTVYPKRTNKSRQNTKQKEVCDKLKLGPVEGGSSDGAGGHIGPTPLLISDDIPIRFKVPDDRPRVEQRVCEGGEAMPDYELQESETKCEPKLNATRIIVAEALLDHFDHSGLLKAEETIPLIRPNLTKPETNSVPKHGHAIVQEVLEQLISDVAGKDLDEEILHENEHDPDPRGAAMTKRNEKNLKRCLEPTEVLDCKKIRTTVVIDSDGEHEEVEECNLSKKVNAQERPEPQLLGREITGASHRKPSTQSGEITAADGSTEKCQPLQSEKSILGNVDSPVTQTQRDDNVDKDAIVRATKKRRGKKFYEPRDIQCTACGMLLTTREVLRHPSISVCICKRCNKFLQSVSFHKEKDGSEAECRWCGLGGEVICCGSCCKVICMRCMSRNFGAKNLVDIVGNSGSAWRCVFCNPAPLKSLIQDYKQAYQLQRIAILEEEEDFSDKEVSIKQRARFNKRNRRYNARVLDEEELDEKTKVLVALEKERQDRLEKWRAAACTNGGTPIRSHCPTKRSSHFDEGLEMCHDDNAAEGYILNKARHDDEEIVRIAPCISAHLRPHQLSGLRFMWENCVESVNKVKSGADGLGCIVAHSMGLGKTLQVIAFIHTIWKKEDLGLRSVLIVVPVNVLHNWRSEFGKWQPPDEKPIPVYMLEDVARDNMKRAMLLSKWQAEGGVMLIGYTAFRNLSMGRTVRDKSVREDLCVSLQHPGPDLLVCDEAHMIKNRKADITQVLKLVRTRRRIALTGSPLQNNLMEYYCMVDFVREGFLGPAPSFKRRFQNPIENGQRADSTSKDVQLMKQRAHVLHKQLKGFVQRKNMSVLKDELPSKCVYVISVRLSPLQRKLYTQFLNSHGLLSPMENHGRQRFLFKAYHALAKIWNHPDLLLLAQEEKDSRKEDNLENFAVDLDDEIPADVEACLDESPREVRSKVGNGSKANAELDDLHKSGWWKDQMEGHVREVVEMSGKMVLLKKILLISSAKRDKALVFSQSLHTLDLIETFLASMPRQHGNGGCWELGRDWYRLDGQTSAKSRQEMVERFNDSSNIDVQCVLISTRAGSLGINLPAANRVIIVDGSWNPTHDLQAIFRAWRFGQKKNVYAYRLLASGTMEEKIYNRQVSKEGLAARVLDGHQVGRFFVEDDLEFLFVLDNDDDGFEFEDTEAGGHDLNKRSESKASVGAVHHLSVDAGGQDLDQPSTSTNSVDAVPPAHLARDDSAVSAQEEGTAAPPPKLKRMAFSVPDDHPPRDDLMGRLLLDYRPRWVVRYHEHEPLLEDLEDEKLSKEEQTLAWESFQREGQEWVPATSTSQAVSPLSTQTPMETPTLALAESPTSIPTMTEIETLNTPVPLPTLATVPSPAAGPSKRKKGKSAEHGPQSMEETGIQSMSTDGTSKRKKSKTAENGQQSTESIATAAFDNDGTAKKHKCRPVEHVRQLIDDNVKTGSSVPCMACGMVISWETVKRRF